MFYLLEDDFTTWFLNAQHLKAVPGRKTDVADVAWIAQLLEHGLVRPSFVPPPEIRELRDLPATARPLSRSDRARLSASTRSSKMPGSSLPRLPRRSWVCPAGRQLQALVAGTTDPDVLAELVRGTLRRKLPALREALAGPFRAHHALLVGQMLGHIEYLDEAIEALSAEIEQATAPFVDKVVLLDTIPGVDRRSAELLLAEIGTDMSRFPTAGHLASWAGLCPGNNESAGKRGPGTTRKGSKWLRSGLIESSNAAVRSKGNYFAAQYARVKGRRGHGRSIVAVAHPILIVAYHVLSRGQPYDDLGPDYFLHRDDSEAFRRRLIPSARAHGTQRHRRAGRMTGLSK